MRPITLAFLLIPFSIYSNVNSAKQIENIANSYFCKNDGQVVDQNKRPNLNVLYHLAKKTFNISLKHNSLSYDLYRKSSSENSSNNYSYEFHRIDISFLNSNNLSEINESKCTNKNLYNYLNSSKKIEKIECFKEITYKNVYNNIDIEFYADINKEFEYNFVLKKGSNLRDLQIKYSGQKSCFIRNDSIFLETQLGQIIEAFPNIYDDLTKMKLNIHPVIIKNSGNECIIGFNGHKKNENTIIIDPIPQTNWSEYFGNLGNDIINDLTTDNSGNIYAIGQTNSAFGIATAGAFHFSNVSIFDAAFISCFNSSGIQQWGTYFSLPVNLMQGKQIELGKSNNSIYIAGSTDASIATPGTYQVLFGGGGLDGFIANISSNGSTLNWCSNIGTSDLDEITDLKIHRVNNIDYPIVSGFTNGNNFINQNNSNAGGIDGFVIKLNSNGSNLIWHTYFGDQGNDLIYSFDINENTNALFCVGETNSSALPFILSSFQSSRNGPSDGFITNLNLTTGAVNLSSFFGGDNNEIISDIQIDQSDNTLYFCGWTNSTVGLSHSNNVIYAPFKLNIKQGDQDNFIARMIPSLMPNSLEWCSYLGGDDMEFGNPFLGGTISLSSDNIFHQTTTLSLNTGTLLNCGAFNEPNDLFINQFVSPPIYKDILISKISKFGFREYSKYYGGEKEEIGTSINFDLQNNNIIFSGSTESSQNISNINLQQGGIDAMLTSVNDGNPAFALFGNNHRIPNSAGPSINFKTDFGDISNFNSLSNFFDIANLGNSNLIITNITSSNLDFTTNFINPVSILACTTLQNFLEIKWNPNNIPILFSLFGSSTASLQIFTNDPVNPTFTINVIVRLCSITGDQEIAISSAFTNIDNNDFNPSITKATDFSFLSISNSTPVTNILYISNLGSIPLNVSNITSSNTDFWVPNLNITIPPCDFITLPITFFNSQGIIGYTNSTIDIYSSDNNESDFKFTVQATGTPKKGISSINNDNYSSKIRIYPNPTTDFLNIVLDENKNLDIIEVFDSQGRKIEDIKADRYIKFIKYYTLKLAAGYYSMRFKFDNGNEYHNFIVN